MVEWSCTKERINERGPCIFVEWSCANKINKSLRTLSLGRMQCTKERINEKGPNISVEWSYAHKRSKWVGTISSGWMIVHIASVKIPECKENISPSTFYGQLPNYNSHVFSLIYPVDDFSLKEVRTWGQCKFSFYCSCVWCESRKSGGKGSSRFPCVNPMVETSSHRVTFRNPSNINDGAPLRKQSTGLTRWLFPQKSSTADLQPDSK